MVRHTLGPAGARRALRAVSTVAFALVCAAVVGTIVVLTVLPRLTGGAALTVLTGSMTPEIPVGSVVLIRPVDPQTLRVGDVATYQVSPESRALVTHRVQSVRGQGDDTRFIFKGDANRGADTEPVPPQAVRGEVWFHVPFLGSLRDAVQGMNAVVLLAPPLLGLYALSLVLSGARDRRRRTAAAPGLDRSVLVARFDRAAWDDDGADPASMAHRLAGVVLAADDESVTVLVTSPPEQLAELGRFVGAMGPTAMWTGSALDPRAWSALEMEKELADATA